MIKLSPCLKKVKQNSPLVLTLTNQVTMNECANGLLAIGASPVMSYDPEDAQTLATQAAATVLNIGTIHEYQLNLLLGAGQKARQANHPLVLDPVGAGATPPRLAAAKKIMADLKPLVIKGNFSEILALADLPSQQKGVDLGGVSPLIEVINTTRDLAASLGSIVITTGETDVASNGKETYLVKGGSVLLTKITGAGCLLGAMIGAYLGANTESPLPAVLAAASHLALAGERAEGSLANKLALGSFKVSLYDQLATINDDDLQLFTGLEVA